MIPDWGCGTVYIEGQTFDSARAMWILHRGDPGEALVLHACGNGESGCVNLGHLYLGDHRQNLYDRYRDRGSDRTGLTHDDVREIRRRDYSAYGSQIATAREFGISRSALERIRARITWAWLED